MVARSVVRNFLSCLMWLVKQPSVSNVICTYLILRRDSLVRFMGTLDPVFELPVVLGEPLGDLVTAAWAE